MNQERNENLKKRKENEFNVKASTNASTDRATYQ